MFIKGRTHQHFLVDLAISCVRASLQTGLDERSPSRSPEKARSHQRANTLKEVLADYLEVLRSEMYPEGYTSSISYVATGNFARSLYDLLDRGKTSAFRSDGSFTPEVEMLIIETIRDERTDALLEEDRRRRILAGDTNLLKESDREWLEPKIKEVYQHYTSVVEDLKKNFGDFFDAFVKPRLELESSSQQQLEKDEAGPLLQAE